MRYDDLVRIEPLLTELEHKAALCLESDSPRARDLARAALELVRALRAGVHPYRDAHAVEADEHAQADDEARATTSLVALERALEECQDRLARAERALAEERSRRP